MEARTRRRARAAGRAVGRLVVVLALLALLIGVGVWIALRDARVAGPGADDRDRPAGRTPPPRAASVTPRVRAPAETGTTTAPVAGTDAAAAVAPERPVEVVAASEAGGTLLVESPDGTPLAGCRVGFVAHDPDGRARRELYGWTDVSYVADVLELGRVFATGPDGRVRLPKFEGWATVAASHRGNVGVLHGMKPRVTSWTLRLAPAVPLSARVRDAAGAVCPGIAVVLWEGVDDDPAAIASAVTDATGVARFRDVAPAGPKVRRWRVGVRAPIADTPLVDVPLTATPPGPVEIVLPAHGAVQVEVVCAAGNVIAEAFDVELRVAPAPDLPSDEHETEPDGPAAGRSRARTDAGVARFPYVGVGLDLEVTAAPPGAVRRTATLRFAGPAGAGETVVARVVAGSVRPAVSGRLVDSAGAPLPAYRAFVRVLEPGVPLDMSFEPVEGASFVTGDDGRFRVAVDAEPVPIAGRKLQFARRAQGDAGVWSFRPIALVDLNGPLPVSGTDLGDVRTVGTGHLVAGVVVDEGGAPIAGASVLATETEPERTGVEHSDRVVTDAAGAFSIDGAAKSPRISVAVEAPGWFLDVPPTFDAGTRSARVVMSRGGAIEGSVRIPEGTATWEVSVIVTGPATRIPGRRARLADEIDVHPDDTGKFSVPGLRPGTADVAVQIGYDPDATRVEFAGVRVSAGETTRDPRLRDVDFSALFRTVTITAVDEAGAPVADAVAAFRVRGSGASWRRSRGGNRSGPGVRPLLLSANRPAGQVFEAVVACPGRRAVHLPDIGEDVTVVLKKASPVLVRVRLPDDVALPAPPYEIAVALEHVAVGDEDSQWSDPRRIDDDRRFIGSRVVEFRVPDPGTYVIALIVWQTEIDNASGSEVATSPPRARVVVEEGSGPVDVIVRPDAAELAEALQPEPAK